MPAGQRHPGAPRPAPRSWSPGAPRRPNAPTAPPAARPSPRPARNVRLRRYSALNGPAQLLAQFLAQMRGSRGVAAPPPAGTLQKALGGAPPRDPNEMQPPGALPPGAPSPPSCWMSAHPTFLAAATAPEHFVQEFCEAAHGRSDSQLISDLSWALLRPAPPRLARPLARYPPGNKKHRGTVTLSGLLRHGARITAAGTACSVRKPGESTNKSNGGCGIKCAAVPGMLARSRVLPRYMCIRS